MKKAIILIMAVAAISACKSEIDEAEVLLRNGLIYKYGDKDPFSGVVVNSQPKELGIEGLCNIQIEKGRLNGKKECFVSGKKTYETVFLSGDKDGVEIKFDPATGEKILVKTWKRSLLNGPSEEYISGTKISEKEYVNGKLDGKEKRWSNDGKTLVTDLLWSENNKQTGFELIPQGKYKYLNGKLHGEQLTYNKSSDGKVFIYETSNYKNGVYDGLYKKYDGFKNPDNPQQILEIVYSNGEPVSGWFNMVDGGKFIQKINLVRDPSGKGKGFYDEYPGTLVPDGLIKKYDDNRQVVFGEELWVGGVKIKEKYSYFGDEHFNILDPSSGDGEYKSVSEEQYVSYTPGQKAIPEINRNTVTNKTPSSVNNCLESWIKSFRKEFGEDSIVVSEQLDEWTDWCGEGKLP